MVRLQGQASRWLQGLRLAAFVSAALLLVAPAHASERLRIAVQKTGTLAWEIGVIRARGLDIEADLDLQVVDVASLDAAIIALRSGAADIIVTDWLWVSRERSLGANFVFYPYSSAIGAVVTDPAKGVTGLRELIGRKLAVAGGPLDKSWLLLQAWTRRSGLDLRRATNVVYGAPPLLAEKAAQGEVDAALEYWNFCADLEARGFTRLIEIADVEKELGASGPVAAIGYVFDGSFAEKHREALSRFFAVARQAKQLIATSPEAWQVVAKQLPSKSAEALAAYQKYYARGIPDRAIADEEADARRLFKVLAEIGGSELVGSANALAPGTYYKGGS
ncbi:MAG: ABC transporter substrate-binding protein [Methylobacteriaceae bacterium]|nr:ABC transporter substrate-binding protein [Methylobacteriaceae bacterium]MBV9395972.1 ABC transporter substrate-binding protein [Methylobacteriaceae bacterium]